MFYYSCKMKMKILWSLMSLITLCRMEDFPDCNHDNWHSLETKESARLECGPAFQNLCYCSRICYEGKHQYVVNCTDTKFKSTLPLENLPNKTQVLIFTGNILQKLPWNIFGTLDRIPSLRVIDMSNNKIREISGKAYHHVKNVQRLSLDFNELSLDTQSNHPRVFSNFISLLELHLTDAFEDGQPRDIAETLHEIFFNSHLDQLIKLHLEQNEISDFKDPNVFCNLPNLLDLHLGDNDLNALNFNLSCLHKLRFLDLQHNNFTKILEQDLKTLDTFAKHNQSVTIDLSNNPFDCSCELNLFMKWMKKTKIFVRNKNLLRCNDNGHKKYLQEKKNCVSRVSMLSPSSGSTVAITMLSLILVGLICTLVYIQREDLNKKIIPVIDSVNKRVRYTSILTVDARENDV
ncbi:trophoblast glycoprotein isoform X1 [Cotesia typhae]